MSISSGFAAPFRARPARLAAGSVRLPLAGAVALAGSIAAYAALGLVMHQPFHEGGRALNAFDLRVYHGAALRLIGGENVYGAPIWKGFGFTYPPFAALVMAPLAGARFAVDRIAITAINLSLLLWTLRRALLIPSARRRRALPTSEAWAVAAFGAAAAIWLEPISVTLGYGQINLLIAALVVFDLSLPEGHRARGAAIGVAAAIKLTPLLFIGYLLLAGQRRAAARAAGVFTGSIALAYAVAPQDATTYWGHALFLNSSRVGDTADVANQSLLGALARLGPIVATDYLLIGAVVLAGVLLAARATRRGDAAAGYSLIAVTTLLASPISWTHHWTLAVPAVLLLARRAYEQHSRRLWAVTGALLALGYAYAPEHLASLEHPLHPGPLTILEADPYVLAALLALTTAGVLTLRGPRRSLRAAARAALSGSRGGVSTRRSPAGATLD